MGVNVGGLARMPHMQALWSAKLHPCDKKVVFSDIIYISTILKPRVSKARRHCQTTDEVSQRGGGGARRNLGKLT